MLISHFEFTPWPRPPQSPSIMFIHINEGVEVIGGINFNTQKTLSFGFYQRTIHNSRPVNDYNLQAMFTPVNEWHHVPYFGVNYRVRCTNNGVISHKNVAYADLIAAGFIGSGWSLIPHYYNAPRDQGIDFFKPIPHNILAGYQPPLDADNNPIFNEDTELPQNIRNWVVATIVEAKGLI